MSDRRLPDIAHDQELYAFEGEFNLFLIKDEDTKRAMYVAWEYGFSSGWNRGVQASFDAIEGKR